MADPTGHIRVLLVDDHPVLRFGLRVIEQMDPSIRIVAEASGVKEARTKIAESRPDVVLLDLRLADGDGLEVCRGVRAVESGVRFICLTSYSDPRYVLSAMAAGVDGYLLKHNSPERIVEAIHTVLRGRLALDPEVASAAAGRRAQGAGAVTDPLGSLSPGEGRVLAEVAEGLTDKEVAATLGVSLKAVRKRLDRIFEKLRVRSRTQAALIHAARRHESSGWK